MNYAEYSYPERNMKFVNDLMEYIIKVVPIDMASTILSIGSEDKVHEKILEETNSVFYLNDRKRYDAEKDKIPYPGQIFDFVFIKSVIEHIRNTDLFLSEINRVLKPGGKVIVLTPDYQKQKSFFYDDYTHVKPFTLRSLKMAMQLNGFRLDIAKRFFYYKAIWESWLFPNGLPVRFAYWLTEKTGIKYFRWGADRQLFVVGEK